MEELHEECGVFGVFQHPQAAQLTYFGLHALQHRGQEGAGIAAADGQGIRCHKGKGLLTEAFRPGDLEPLAGSCAGSGMCATVRPAAAKSRTSSRWWRGAASAALPQCTTARSSTRPSWRTRWKAAAASFKAPPTARSCCI